MSNPASTGKYIYDVSLEIQPDGSYIARVLGWTDCQVSAATTTEAVAKVKQLLSDKIANTQIIQIEVNTISSNHHNPWLTSSGIFKDDPYFDEMLMHVEQYRKELDREDGAN
jgi:cellulase/cellobiase CelA1